MLSYVSPRAVYVPATTPKPPKCPPPTQSHIQPDVCTSDKPCAEKPCTTGRPTYVAPVRKPVPVRHARTCVKTENRENYKELLYDSRPDSLELIVQHGCMKCIAMHAWVERQIPWPVTVVYVNAPSDAAEKSGKPRKKCAKRARVAEHASDDEDPTVDHHRIRIMPAGVSCTWSNKTRASLLIGDNPPPLRHQAVLADLLSDPLVWRRLRRYLLYWRMGTGKTKAVLYALLKYLNSIPADTELRVVVVCPITVIAQWCSTIEGFYFGDRQRIRFVVIGYQELARLLYHNASYLRNCMFIIDEAQYYRNMTKPMVAAVQCFAEAAFTFVLSGTPVVNDVAEIGGVLRLMDPTCIIDDDDDSADKQHSVAFYQQKISSIMPGRVFFYDPVVMDPDFHRESFPTLDQSVIEVPMTWVQTMEYLFKQRSTIRYGGYCIETSRSNAYDNLLRFTCNSYDDDNRPKLIRLCNDLVQRLQQPDSGPMLVYSHFHAIGIEPLRKLVAEMVPTARIDVISGRVAPKSRDAIQNRYNQRQLDVLFISDAAHEGIDLFNTDCLFLTEPHKNLQSEMQTINRTVRCNGSVPGTVVKVFKYISTFPVPATLKTDDLKALDKHFFTHYITKSRSEQVDHAAELKRMIASVDGETVDQKTERTNREKQLQIELVTDLLQRIGTVPPYALPESMQARHESIKKRRV